MWNWSLQQKALRWVLASALGAVILMVAGWWSPTFYPAEDHLGFLRQIFDIGGCILIRSTAAVGILLFMSLIQNGNWLDQIGETQYGPTILTSVVLYSVLAR